MKFLSLIAVAAVATAFAVPLDSATNKLDRPKAVLLEIGKEYTWEELENLRANAPAEPWSQKSSKQSMGISKRDSTSPAVDAEWNCPIAGALDRLVVGRLSVFSPTNAGGQCRARWTVGHNMESWTAGEWTQFSSADGFWPVSNTAVHNFCLTFTNNICTYHLEAPFVQLVRNFEENPNIYGDAAPSAPTLRETCVTLHGGAGAVCPAMASGNCVLTQFE